MSSSDTGIDVARRFYFFTNRTQKAHKFPPSVAEAGLASALMEKMYTAKQKNFTIRNNSAHRNVHTLLPSMSSR